MLISKERRINLQIGVGWQAIAKMVGVNLFKKFTTAYCGGCIFIFMNDGLYFIGEDGKFEPATDTLDFLISGEDFITEIL